MTARKSDREVEETDRPEIRALDRTTIERIAAGEVVERPASVVKELVENSLDADASRIAVEVENGGVDRIRVSDDGIGMSEEDVRTAVQAHTTSKIRDIDDLESGVGTLGFRGEALHTIGAVSRMTVTTKPRGSSDAGTKLRFEGGTVESVEPAGCPEGTTIEVEDLFYNTPARKKYLSRESTEFTHVNRVVTQYALANPEVSVSLSHNDREVFATTGQGDLQETILSVYGREVATSMIEVGDAPDDGPVRDVRGYVSHPETNRSSREYVSTYVNGRYVTESTLREAVLSAYGSQLATDRYPFAVLFIGVSAESVDVNVHPRKMEVRFDDEDGVRRDVESAVEDALLSEGLIRSSAPRGRSAPDQTVIEPERDDGEASDEDRHEPAATEDRSVDRSASERGTARSVGSESTTSAPSDDPERAPSGGATGASPSRSNATSPPSRTETSASAASSSGEGPIAGEDGRIGGTAPSAEGTANRRAGRDRETSDREPRFRAPTEQSRLGEEGNEDVTFETLPSLRVLGQFDETYLVAETDDGLALIDQHAADERINYERLKREFEGDTTTQALAEPVTVELTANEASLFEEYREPLARLGFRAGLVDDRTVEVRTVPTVVDEALDADLLRDALSTFVSTDPDERGRETVEAAADELLADLACYPSITGNTSLTDGSIVDLLSALDDCENPYACPHGRPVVIELSREEIEDRFERDYPGHGGRRST